QQPAVLELRDRELTGERRPTDQVDGAAHRERDRLAGLALAAHEVDPVDAERVQVGDLDVEARGQLDGQRRQVDAAGDGPRRGDLDADVGQADAEHLERRLGRGQGQVAGDRAVAEVDAPGEPPAGHRVVDAEAGDVGRRVDVPVDRDRRL